MVEKISNVYLFTGEEDLLIEQEIKKRKQGFASKNGENAVFVFDSENFDNNQVIQTSFGSGFFSTATLTILKGLPLSANSSASKYQIFIDEFFRRKGQIPDGSFLVFANSKPDKRAKLYKFLKANATIKEFSKLKKPQLKQLIIQNLAVEEIKIETDALEFFLAKTGDNLHIIINEIDKLVQRYKSKGQEKQNNTTITVEMVEQITYDYEKQDAFKFFGTLFKYGKEKTFRFVDKISQEDTNRNMFLGSVYWTLNLYLILLDFFAQGKETPDQITKEYKINPFVLKINLGQKEAIKKHAPAIKKMYTGMVELDHAIKTGKKDQSEFWITLKRYINYFGVMLIVLGTSIFSFFTLQSTASADFQDKLYCSLHQETLTVSLKSENSYPCKNYVLYLKNKIIKEYQEIQKINTLIHANNNKIFWIDIKTNKQKNIKTMLNLVKIIEKKAKKFEVNLIKNLRIYLKKYFAYDREKYTTMLETIKPYRQIEKIKILYNRIIIANMLIDKILRTESMDILSSTFIQYIYLKKTIKGTLES